MNRKLCNHHWCLGILLGALAGGGHAAEDNPFAPPELVYPAPDAVLGWVDSRSVETLNGAWYRIVDPMGVGDPGSLFGGFQAAREPKNRFELIEYDFRRSPTLRVPGDFNSQEERLFFYQGRVWYARDFEATTSTNERTHLWFGGANFNTLVFLNGKAVGEHRGGYVPFSFDITDALREGTNTLVVRVDNRLTDSTVPTARTDWWPYGGLTRDVALVRTPKAFLRNARVRLVETETAESDQIEVEIHSAGFAPGTQIRVELPTLQVSASAGCGTDGITTVTFNAAVERWSPSNPARYRIIISAAEDRIEDKVGFRSIEVQGQRLLLNGEPIKLKGISTHEEAIGRDGVAYSEQDMRRLLKEAKALGVNFVRAAHYPYSRHLARVADEVGVMLWEEIPVYWNIDWDNEETLALARNQLQRLIQRDWNRASVIIWSVANETPFSEPRMRFLRQLIDDARQLDPSRLVSAALLGNPRGELAAVAAQLAARGLADPTLPEAARTVFTAMLAQAGATGPSPDDTVTLQITDPLGAFVDVIGYNEYFGWYYSALFSRQLGVDEAILRALMLDFIPQLRITAAFDKPIHISEFGAGALAGRRGTGVWSERYQARVYEAQLRMLSASPQVQGMTPWVLKDFRAMLRTLPTIQDYRNRKGLINENGRRKRAFYVLRDFYQDADRWNGLAPP